MISAYTNDGRKLLIFKLILSCNTLPKVSALVGNEPMQQILGQVNPFMQEDTNDFDHNFWDKAIEDYA